MKKGYVEGFGITKKIKIGGKEITATYSPDSGLFSFDKVRGITESSYLEKTGFGAFKTMKALIEGFREYNPPKITYFSSGKTEKEVQVKERLYARELERLGYTLQSTRGELRRSDSFSYDGPTRTWVKKEERNNRSMRRKSLVERIASLVFISGVVGGIFFLSSNLTGNVIGNLTQSTSNFIGMGLFLVGLVGAFFYFKKKK